MTDADFLHEEPPGYGGGGKPDPITEYLRKIERALKRGDATEHTHRPALKELIEALDENVICTNEPRRSDCGAPDYVVSRKRDQLTLGWMEAKNIGADLAEFERGDQLKRYLPGLPNLLFTDYLDFRWFVDGKKRETFRLAHVLPGGKIVPVAAEELERARLLILGFTSQKPVAIATAEQLARRLASLAHIMRDIIIRAFLTGQPSQQLRDWRNAFAATLLPELASHTDAKKEAGAVSEFADMFAQTLTYGMFSARAASGSGKFTREKAQRLIPRTNPFLRAFFEQITGAALDDEPFAGIVEDLIQTLDHADMGRVMEDFGKHGRRRDPVVHFYETFLQAYDPKLRELRGVYYTPEPVVNYIVQSIDRLLKDKFGIKAGLADHQKITVKRKEGDREITDETHRVLILDPATGTATFLYTVLDFIRSQFKTRKNAGQWGSYVHEHLLPRLFGFELLMAPYAVAHFKIGLALAAMDEEPLFRQQWSYEPQGDERVNIFLTNTLEDLEHTTEQLGPLRALSNEANSAYEVKKHKPVLVVLGNPPYSGHSANTGEWISKLVRDYYFCDGQPLGERNPKWLQDDYVKFLRWGQWRIEQTGQGVLAFITNHGYLSNVTFRGMREHLMRTFDEIYLLDLHGSTKKKEVVPNTGEQDKNIFDIQQGVAIGIFVKRPATEKGKKKKSANVYHNNLWGSQRKAKYDWLEVHHVNNTQWKTINPISPRYLFFPYDRSLEAEYDTGWDITAIMPVNNLAITTGDDDKTIGFDQKHSIHLADQAKVPRSCITNILYRPFDERRVLYHDDVITRPRHVVVEHLVAGNNLALLTARNIEIVGPWNHVFCTQLLAQLHSVSLKEVNYLFPVYLYPTGKLNGEELFAHENGRRPNFSSEFIREYCKKLGVRFVPEGIGRPSKKEIGAELLFNYLYALFYSPGYRSRYAEFLRLDFPRLPITSNFELFRTLAGFGGELVDLHARGNGKPQDIGFPVKGDNVIEEARYQPPQGRDPGRVWINNHQYVAGVPETAWTFPIGGYLPAQRWLKDRIGRALGYDEQSEYQRIVWALMETRRLMGEIDAAIKQHGGWPMK